MKFNFNIKSIHIVTMIFLAAGLLTMALKWQSEPMITATELDAQGYVWMEYVYFDKKWVGNLGHAGHRSKTYPPPPLGTPSSGSTTTNRPLPVPNWAYFSWFNFSQQRYFEALMDDSGMRERAKKIARSKIKWRNYTYSLIYDFSENGTVRLWLSACDLDRSTPDWKYCALLGTAQGYEIDGNPGKYKENTVEARETGLIPMQPQPPHPATQPKRKSIDESF